MKKGEVVLVKDEPGSRSFVVNTSDYNQVDRIEFLEYDYYSRQVNGLRRTIVAEGAEINKPGQPWHTSIQSRTIETAI